MVVTKVIANNQVLSRVFPLAETYHHFAENILHGNVQTGNYEQRNRRMTVLRFLKDIPEIIGADMKSYGPFKVEDIASLPKDNAKILIKQGMVEKIDTC
jgi:DNA replication initiation complex subunit (GINS family)